MEKLLVNKVIVVLLFVMAQSALSAQQPQVPPRLKWKDGDVLLIECGVPYFNLWRKSLTALTELVDLQIFYKGMDAIDKLIANMTASSTKPRLHGRFKNEDSMIRAEGRKIPEAGKNCRSCRVLVVFIPKSPNYKLTGTYFCFADFGGHTTGRIEYRVTVDEPFVQRSQTKTNGTLTVKSMKAHEIKITYDIPSEHPGPVKVTVSRTVVDKESHAVQGTTEDILFETVNDKPAPYKNHGTLLFKSSQTPEGQGTVILFVQTSKFCYPNCMYSCEVYGQVCERNLGMKTAVNLVTETTVRGSSSYSEDTVIGLGTGLVVTFVLLIIAVIVSAILWRKLSSSERPGQEENGTDADQEGADAPERHDVCSGRGDNAAADGDVCDNVTGAGDNADRGVEDNVRGADASTDRGVVDNVRAAGDNADRGVQDNVRGADAAAERDVDVDLRDTAASVGRDVGDNVGGGGANAERTGADLRETQTSSAEQARELRFGNLCSQDTVNENTHLLVTEV